MLTLSTVPAPARTIGLAGLIPFVACAVAVWAGTPEIQLEGLRMQMGYAAVILTFLGGVHWGRALQTDSMAGIGWERLIWSVTPCLIAWIALRMHPAIALFVFIGTFSLAFFIDRRAVKAGFLPDWYLDLRKVLTLGALMCLTATLARFTVLGPS